MTFIVDTFPSHSSFLRNNTSFLLGNQGAQISKYIVLEKDAKQRTLCSVWTRDPQVGPVRALLAFFTLALIEEEAPLGR